MKKSAYGDLNLAQSFFNEHKNELLASLNGWKDQIELDDLSQLVLLKLGKVKDRTFVNLQNPRAYTFKILNNAAIDLARKTKRRTGNGAESGGQFGKDKPNGKGKDKNQDQDNVYELEWHETGPGLSPEDTMLAKICVDEFFRRCTKEEKELLGYVYEDLENQEIAERMGIPQATVRKRKERLFRKLRKDPP